MLMRSSSLIVLVAIAGYLFATGQWFLICTYFFFANKTTSIAYCTQYVHSKIFLSLSCLLFVNENENEKKMNEKKKNFETEIRSSAILMCT